MTFSDNTIAAEGPDNFFRNIAKTSAQATKKLTTNVMKGPARSSEIGAKIGTAVVSINQKATLSTITEVINFLSYW